MNGMMDCLFIRRGGRRERGGGRETETDTHRERESWERMSEGERDTERERGGYCMQLTVVYEWYDGLFVYPKRGEAREGGGERQKLTHTEKGRGESWEMRSERQRDTERERGHLYAAQ